MRSLPVPGARRAALAAFVLLALGRGCSSFQPSPPPPPAVSRATPTATATQRGERLSFEATAYSLDGKTASGRTTREGIVAADPDVLPLGSLIRVYEAGSYSGQYTVADTGRTIRGREIDIFISDAGEAKRFGRRRVDVEILRRGSESKGADLGAVGRQGRRSNGRGVGTAAIPDAPNMHE